MNDILDLINEAEQLPDEENNSPTIEQADTQPCQATNSSTMLWMVDFIKQHKTDIPEELRGTITTDDKTGLTLAIHWVHIMKTVAVPVWMRHDPKITDSNGWTIAIHYIVTNLAPPPIWMSTDPTIQTSNGRTCAMYLLLYRGSDHENENIPVWMHHDVNIFDSLGYSLIDYWLATNNDDIPSWMLENIVDVRHWVNGNGENIAISYMLRRGTLPTEQFALPDEEIDTFRTKMNNTYRQLLNTITCNKSDHETVSHSSS